MPRDEQQKNPHLGRDEGSSSWREAGLPSLSGIRRNVCGPRVLPAPIMTVNKGLQPWPERVVVGSGVTLLREESLGPADVGVSIRRITQGQQEREMLSPALSLIPDAVMRALIHHISEFLQERCSLES